MPDRDGYIAGVPCWVDTNQPDPDAAAEFYGALFGWETEDAMPPGLARQVLHGADPRPRRRRHQQPDGAGAADAGTRTSRSTAPTTPRRRCKRGGRHRAERAVRRLRLRPHGRVRRPPGRDVLASGSPTSTSARGWSTSTARVNFNDLAHRPTSRARRRSTARSSAGACSTWAAQAACGRCPAYGDHLEELNPGTRERFGEMGAPGGFIDAVASVRPADGGTPAHWSVTFGVDDADAIAAKAEELGGKVRRGRRSTRRGCGRA